MNKKYFEEELKIGDYVVGTGFGVMYGKCGLVEEIDKENGMVFVWSDISPDVLKITYRSLKVVTPDILESLKKYDKILHEIYPGLPGYFTLKCLKKSQKRKKK